MPTDANLIGQEERRRAAFKRWLLKAWDWADEAELPCAAVLEELVMRADEPDYPLWGVAQKRGVIGDGALADLLRGRFGLPPQTARETEWEKQINYSPVIYLEETLWRRIYESLGWANRDSDPNRPDCFWLWSNAANVIRFQMRKKEGTYDASV